MEGPSLVLAAELLRPFKNKCVAEVKGNTKIGKERICQQEIVDIFTWGKHLVIQFATFALRIHFLLYGSFEAVIDERKVTGDYPAKNRAPRLQLIFSHGQIVFYSCSLQYLETPHAREIYDFSIDIMSSDWDSKKALQQMKQQKDSELGDLLLDQSIFAGVGNIIKNEVLYLIGKSPTQLLRALSLAERKGLITVTQQFSHQFYEWRKHFELRKHYKIYRKSICPKCQNKIVRRKTGKRMRLSYFCPHCQK